MLAAFALFEQTYTRHYKNQSLSRAALREGGVATQWFQWSDGKALLRPTNREDTNLVRRTWPGIRFPLFEDSVYHPITNESRMTKEGASRLPRTLRIYRARPGPGPSLEIYARARNETVKR